MICRPELPASNIACGFGWFFEPELAASNIAPASAGLFAAQKRNFLASLLPSRGPFLKYAAVRKEDGG
jgi:hypothetical protein